MMIAMPNGTVFGCPDFGLHRTQLLTRVQQYGPWPETTLYSTATHERSPETLSVPGASAPSQAAVSTVMSVNTVCSIRECCVSEQISLACFVKLIDL